ncbi:MAG: hypothetical protein ACTSVL_11080, partial [Promethearchaeota archaeon]
MESKDSETYIAIIGMMKPELLKPELLKPELLNISALNINEKLPSLLLGYGIASIICMFLYLFFIQ